MEPMKMTFEVPDELAARFRAVVPGGERSKLLCELIRERVSRRELQLEAACRKANKLASVNTEMRDWEKLNESEG
jgi:hypothetical protein